MKSLPPKPSSILPTRPSDIGRGTMTTQLKAPPKMDSIRATKDWKK